MVIRAQQRYREEATGTSNYQKTLRYRKSQKKELPHVKTGVDKTDSIEGWVGQSGAESFAGGTVRTSSAINRRILKHRAAAHQEFADTLAGLSFWWAAARSMGKETSCRWQWLMGSEAVHLRAALAHPVTFRDQLDASAFGSILKSHFDRAPRIPSLPDCRHGCNEIDILPSKDTPQVE